VRWQIGTSNCGVVTTVVVVVDEVVGGAVEVVVEGAVVEVVVVGVGDWHCGIPEMSGSGPPSSKPMTMELP